MILFLGSVELALDLPPVGLNFVLIFYVISNGSASKNFWRFRKR